MTWLTFITIGSVVSIVGAAVFAGAGWGVYFYTKGDDRRKVVDASTNLLTEMLKKLASVSDDKALKTQLAIFMAIRNLFSALANLQSILEQWRGLCADPSSNAMFQQTPSNVSANYTASCTKYAVLYPLVDPFLREGVSIEAFMAAAADVVTALMRLDNAIVADP